MNERCKMQGRKFFKLSSLSPREKGDVPDDYLHDLHTVAHE